MEETPKLSKKALKRLERSTHNKKTWSECCGKQLYYEEEYAIEMADKTLEESKIKVRVYFCILCNGWHLTRLGAK